MKSEIGTVWAFDLGKGSIGDGRGEASNVYLANPNAGRENEGRMNRMHRMAKPPRNDERIHPVNPVHPVWLSGVNEILCKCGGADQLRSTVNRLQSLLYAV